jgi:cytochrome c oxidase subunit 3
LPISKALGVSDYLIYWSIVPTLCVIGFGIAAVVFKSMERSSAAKLCVALVITVGGYFLGAVGGHYYIKVKEAADSSHASQQWSDSDGRMILSADIGGRRRPNRTDEASNAHPAPVTPDLDRDVGIFFSIYYCMTGLHAFHILGGIVALAWIYSRSVRDHWRPDYFGPVDFVGLYWHLVDLIWIYLFPLLYLID